MASQSDIKSRDEKVQLISDTIRQAWPTFSERWKMQEKAYEYVRSIQYTPAQEAYYSGQRRPTNVFNIMFDKINHIVGDQILGDQAMPVQAKAGTADMAASWERLNDHWNDRNDYRRQTLKTILAGFLGGGVLHTRYTDEQEIDGSVVFTNEDEFCVMWDPRAREMFGDDAKWMARFRWMTPRDIMAEEKWKGRAGELKELVDLSKTGDLLHESSEWKIKNYADPVFNDKKNGQHLVIEFHEINREMMEVLVDPMRGTVMPFDVRDPKRRDLYLRANPGLRVMEKRWKKKTVTSVIPGLNFYLDEQDADTQDGTYDILIYHPYPYGRFLHQHYGMSPLLIGPQNHINDLENRFLDTVNRNANAGIEIVKDAYDNPEAVDNAGQAGTVYEKKLKYADSTTIRRLESPSFAGMDFKTMIQDALFFVDIMTITENQAGRKESSNEPASLFAQRVIQSQIRFAVPQYCVYSLRKRLGDKNIRLTQANLTEPKMMMIVNKRTNETEQMFVNTPFAGRILNDLSIGEYEVTIDDASKSPMAQLMRQQSATFVVELLMKAFGQEAARVIDWDGFLEKMNLGDMSDQKDLIHEFITAMSAQQGEAGAMDKMKNIIGLVKENVDLQDDTGEQPPTGAGGGKSASRPAQPPKR